MGFSRYNTKRFKPEPPVKEGDDYEVVIESVGEKGDGIAKIQGFVVIVKEKKKGEKVKVKIKAVRGSVSFAEIVEKQGTAEIPQPTKQEDGDSDDFGSDDDSEDEDDVEESDLEEELEAEESS